MMAGSSVSSMRGTTDLTVIGEEVEEVVEVVVEEEEEGEIGTGIEIGKGLGVAAGLEEGGTGLAVVEEETGAETEAETEVATEVGTDVEIEVIPGRNQAGDAVTVRTDLTSRKIEKFGSDPEKMRIVRVTNQCVVHKLQFLSYFEIANNRENRNFFLLQLMFNIVPCKLVQQNLTRPFVFSRGSYQRSLGFGGGSWIQFGSFQFSFWSGPELLKSGSSPELR